MRRINFYSVVAFFIFYSHNGKIFAYCSNSVAFLTADMRYVHYFRRIVQIRRDCRQSNSLVGKRVHIYFAAVKVLQKIYKFYIPLHTVRHYTFYGNICSEDFIHCVKIAGGGNIGFYIVLLCGIHTVYGIHTIFFFNRNPERPHHIKGHLHIIKPVRADCFYI